MIIKGIFVTMVLFIVGCNKNKKYHENIDKINDSEIISSQYIKLRSLEGDEYVILSSDLNNFTYVKYKKLNVSKHDVFNIIKGKKILSKEYIKTIRKDCNAPIFKINKIVNKKELDSLTYITIDLNGLFKLRDIEDINKGSVIANAVSKGYIISFSEIEGEYFWEVK